MMGEENDVGACRRRSVRKRGVTRMPSFGLDAFARPAGNGDTALDQRHAALAAQILAKADPCIGVYRQAMMDVNRDNVERVRRRLSERCVEERYGIPTARQRDGHLASAPHVQRKGSADRDRYARGRLRGRDGRFVARPVRVS